MHINLYNKAAACLFVFVLLASCKKEMPDPVVVEIDKAIELIHANKAINDTLQRYRKDYGVDFMFCYIITSDNHRRLGMQVMQSANENGPPMLLDYPHKIETVQGIDILFVSSDRDRTKKYEILIDEKTKKLIDKGYVTVDGTDWTYCTSSIELIFCKNDEKVFTILSPDFKSKEADRTLTAGKPYSERKFYPDCGIVPEKKKKASPWRS